MSQANLNAVKVAHRDAWATYVYKGFLTIGALTAGYIDFPGNKAFVSFAVLLVSWSVVAINMTASVRFLTNNAISDLAERKTRHAILLASSAEKDEYYFWNEVDRRVAAEDDGGEPIKWPTHAGMFIFSLAKFALGDALSVTVALIFSAFAQG